MQQKKDQGTGTLTKMSCPFLTLFSLHISFLISWNDFQLICAYELTTICEHLCWLRKEWRCQVKTKIVKKTHETLSWWLKKSQNMISVLCRIWESTGSPSQSLGCSCVCSAVRDNGSPSWCFLVLSMLLTPAVHSDLELLEWAPHRPDLVDLCPAFEQWMLSKSQHRCV